MKRILISFIAIMLFFLLGQNILSNQNFICFAEDSFQSIETEVDKQLSDLDLSQLDQVIKDFASTSKYTSFKEIVKSLVDGSYKVEYGSVFQFIIKNFSNQIVSILPIVVTIIILAVMASLMKSFRPNINSKSISDLISLVCYCLVVILVVALIKNLYDVTGDTLKSMSNQMEIIFPVLLTLLTATGGLVSVGIYTPLVSTLTTGVGTIFSKILYPMCMVAFILVVVNNLSDNLKLDKMSKFVSSLFKWGVGIVFTLFGAFLTIQGISAGKYDSVSLKATRFAMKNSIPIVGGYLSDGLDYVLLSSILIKNAVGIGGLLILMAMVLSPIIKILIIKLALQFAAGILESISGGKIANFCEGCSKVLVYPLVIILSVSFMYILTVGLIMCTMAGVA